MKRTIVMLAVATASMLAFSQPPQNSTPAPKTAPAPVTVTKLSVPLVKKENAPPPAHSVLTNPLRFFTKPVVKPKVWSVDGMSSRPWMQIVGTRPGFPLMPRPELREPGMFWIGANPH